jgi:integrase
MDSRPNQRKDAAGTHKILNGKVQLFRRSDDGPWHCSASFGGSTQRRKSTKETSLALAKEVAEDWYLEMKGKARSGQLEKEKSFADAADKFAEEYEATTKGHRSPKWVQGHKDRIRLHLLPYFGKTPLPDISAGVAQDYRAWRMTEPEGWKAQQLARIRAQLEKKNSRKKTGKPVEIADSEIEVPAWTPPARNTLHNEIVTLSMILKTAHRHGWIEQVPDLSDPYRRQSKVEHRPWFTPNEYKQLYTLTRENAAKPKNPRYKWYAEQLHDFVLFMANTGLRPDEVRLLQFRDVEIADDPYNGERILEIEVHGKRGTGYCKSMPGAVRPFERLRDRGRVVPGQTDEDGKPVLRLPEPNDLLFPNEFKRMFNNLMEENDLKNDRHGKPRTAYSLRHSYICFRLLEGADIYQVAKNCRTSVEMIEKHYAAHLKDMIDTSLINVRKERQQLKDQADDEAANGKPKKTPKKK